MGLSSFSGSPAVCTGRAHTGTCLAEPGQAEEGRTRRSARAPAGTHQPPCPGTGGTDKPPCPIPALFPVLSRLLAAWHPHRSVWNPAGLTAMGVNQREARISAEGKRGACGFILDWMKSSNGTSGGLQEDGEKRWVGKRVQRRGNNDPSCQKQPGRDN